MHSHGWKQWKTYAHEWLTCKNDWIWTKSPRSNQLLGVNQHLRVTSNSWLTIFFLHFFMSLTWASYMHHEKGIFYDFLMFFIVFNNASTVSLSRSLREAILYPKRENVLTSRYLCTKSFFCSSDSVSGGSPNARIWSVALGSNLTLLRRLTCRSFAFELSVGEYWEILLQKSVKLDMPDMCNGGVLDNDH